VVVPREVFRSEMNESGYKGRAAARGFSPAAAARHSKFGTSVGAFSHCMCFWLFHRVV